MKIIADILSLVGFLLLLDFNLFCRWYIEIVLRNTHTEKYNLVDWWIVNKYVYPKLTKYSWIVSKPPLGLFLVFLGVVLSLMMDV